MDLAFTPTARRLGFLSAVATGILMVVYGVTLALGGLSGVVFGDMRLRNVGILGYVGVFLAVAALLAVLFRRAEIVESQAADSTS